ncbi:hypothetical protein J4212_00570 [Candidatus Woesearchaeota archaeon]|nr:hypothetical protein [Candidatus Woesearchaeota archaeon]
MANYANNRSGIRASIRSKIIEIVENSDKPVSTLELASGIRRAWHSVNTQCLKLQLEGKINGFRVGNMNLWTAKAVQEKKV